MSNEADYMKRVMRTLTNNPTAADIDFLVEAFTRVGYLAGEAEKEADMAYARRKYSEAEIWKSLSADEPRKTAAAIEKLVELEVHAARVDEVEAKARATKIKNLLNAIQEAINAIKFIGRMGG